MLVLFLLSFPELAEREETEVKCRAEPRDASKTRNSHFPGEDRTKSRWCKKALTTSQRLQMSFVEIGDEHIFKLKIQKGT